MKLMNFRGKLRVVIKNIVTAADYLQWEVQITTAINELHDVGLSPRQPDKLSFLVKAEIKSRYLTCFFRWTTFIH